MKLTLKKLLLCHAGISALLVLIAVAISSPIKPSAKGLPANGIELNGLFLNGITLIGNDSDTANLTDDKFQRTTVTLNDRPVDAIQLQGSELVLYQLDEATQTDE